MSKQNENRAFLITTFFLYYYASGLGKPSRRITNLSDHEIMAKIGNTLNLTVSLQLTEMTLGNVYIS